MTEQPPRGLNAINEMVGGRSSFKRGEMIVISSANHPSKTHLFDKEFARKLTETCRISDGLSEHAPAFEKPPTGDGLQQLLFELEEINSPYNTINS